MTRQSCCKRMESWVLFLKYGWNWGVCHTTSQFFNALPNILNKRFNLKRSVVPRKRMSFSDARQWKGKLSSLYAISRWIIKIVMISHILWRSAIRWKNRIPPFSNNKQYEIHSITHADSTSKSIIDFAET